MVRLGVLAMAHAIDSSNSFHAAFITGKVGKGKSPPKRQSNKRLEASKIIRVACSLPVHGCCLQTQEQSDGLCSVCPKPQLTDISSGEPGSYEGYASGRAGQSAGGATVCHVQSRRLLCVDTDQ